MIGLAQGLAGLAGYELLPRRKLRLPAAQLAATLTHHRVDAVIDVGANQGQYGRQLRAAGWRGPILSIEPQAELQGALRRVARRRPPWQVLEPMAVGVRSGSATLEVSAENDMSSLCAQTPSLRALSPSSIVVERRQVPLRRLDELTLDPAWRRLFVKLDLQGGERAALDGARGLLPRISGWQVEMALLPLYDGEADWRSTIDHLAAIGFDLHLLMPGYFARPLMRQVQVDGVFFRDNQPNDHDPSGGPAKPELRHHRADRHLP